MRDNIVMDDGGYIIVIIIYFEKIYGYIDIF